MNSYKELLQYQIILSTLFDPQFIQDHGTNKNSNIGKNQIDSFTLMFGQDKNFQTDLQDQQT